MYCGAGTPWSSPTRAVPRATEEWARAIRGPGELGPGWGSVDYDDCMAVIDEAVRRFDFVDPDRLGVIGGSYGGYMTSWIVGHTDRFKAAVSERAVNNFDSQWGSSDFGWDFKGYMGTFLFEDVEAYLRVSPSTYAENIHTPLLILHSEEDLRCPVEQAEHLFVTLRLLKRPVEFVRFPAESHELTRSGSPLHRVQRFETRRRVVRPLPQRLRRGSAGGAGARRAGAGGARRERAGGRNALRRAAGRPPARWVRVSVATLWVRPGEARRVDAPALAVPADPRPWLAGLTTTQERWLVGRLETQALYGAKVYLLGTSGSWSRVAVAGQPTPRNAWGYPGWLPTRQLTATEPAATVNVAMVRWPTLVVVRGRGPERARARGLLRHAPPGRSRPRPSPSRWRR